MPLSECKSVIAVMFESLPLSLRPRPLQSGLKASLETNTILQYFNTNSYETARTTAGSWSEMASGPVLDRG